LLVVLLALELEGAHEPNVLVHSLQLLVHGLKGPGVRVAGHLEVYFPMNQLAQERNQQLC